MRTLEGSRKWVHHSDHKITMPEGLCEEKKFFSKKPILAKENNCETDDPLLFIESCFDTRPWFLILLL